MSDKCSKCGSDGLYVRFVPNRKVIEPSGRHKIETEFVTSNEYEFFWQHVSAKDHLLKSCRSCGYAWRENTADSKEISL